MRPYRTCGVASLPTMCPVRRSPDVMLGIKHFLVCTAYPWPVDGSGCELVTEGLAVQILAPTADVFLGKTRNPVWLPVRQPPAGV